MTTPKGISQTEHLKSKREVHTAVFLRYMKTIFHKFNG